VLDDAEKARSALESSSLTVLVETKQWQQIFS